MLSTHRLLIMLIAMNMMIGIAVSIYNSPQTLDTKQMEVENEKLEESEEYAEEEQSIWGSIKASAEKGYESTIGNPIRWGWTILRIFIRGINPFSFMPSDFTNEIEQEIARVLILIRSLITTITIIEGYMVFKNDKQS